MKKLVLLPLIMFSLTGCGGSKSVNHKVIKGILKAARNIAAFHFVMINMR